MARTKNKKAEPEFLEMAPLQYHMPLTGKNWIGGDGKKWRDIAVDSTGTSVIAWVRKRVEDSKYFLVVSVVRAHVLAYELTVKEAKELYHALPSKAPYKRAFNVPKKKKKVEEDLDKEVTNG